jgi:hypothetical protein
MTSATQAAAGNTAKWSETESDTDATRGSIELDAKVWSLFVFTRI